MKYLSKVYLQLYLLSILCFVFSSQWQYLSHIFSENDVKEKFADLATRFAYVDLQYQVWLSVGKK